MKTKIKNNINSIFIISLLIVISGNVLLGYILMNLTPNFFNNKGVFLFLVFFTLTLLGIVIPLFKIRFSLVKNKWFLVLFMFLNVITYLVYFDIIIPLFFTVLGLFFYLITLSRLNSLSKNNFYDLLVSYHFEMITRLIVITVLAHYLNSKFYCEIFIFGLLVSFLLTFIYQKKDFCVT